MEHVEGPWCQWHQGPEGTTHTICRPWYCAGLPHAHPGEGGECGDRGCVTGDHLTIDVLRYPDSRGVRAILMAPWFLRSSPLDHSLTKRELRTADTANCCNAGTADTANCVYCRVLRTAGDLSERHSSAASPVAHPASALA
ncbi:DUF5707 domain-containing protein [Streptomyces sp. NPDC053429]|uniref:DUF5707 domain-containing protein n=1 Tax=Streptomyces sp. NPDC053429 TaxID=3365702 RepID=UPI0037D1DB71